MAQRLVDRQAQNAPGFEASSLHRRLLQDIAELEKDPYPNIRLHVHDEDITRACLILTPYVPHRFSYLGRRPLHLTVKFPADYPLRAPRVSTQTRINHPNVFNGYICASILNTEEGWTPAYTLKGIAIQLLSFFSSDSIEQSSGHVVDLTSYKGWRSGNGEWQLRSGLPLDMEGALVRCETCGFDSVKEKEKLERELKPGRLSRRAKKRDNKRLREEKRKDEGELAPIKCEDTRKKRSASFLDLPDEVLLLILKNMDTADIISFSDAVPQIKSVLRGYDFIRMRELQCFCLKKSMMEARLGIGVSVNNRGKKGLASEFDLLSNEAFVAHGIRKSIQGVPFQHWIPVPLSRRHWEMVKDDCDAALHRLHGAAGLGDSSTISVLYHFMNNIVVQFSLDAEYAYHIDERSTLTHASEKAVESYFTLFHLLVCLATEDANIIGDANRMVDRFLAGERHKTAFPDLGLLLVATLISDHGLTEALTFAIIKEAILRNVVWMLDRRGAGMPELSYLESTAVSDYRLSHTFEASTTSYRLLMFLKLFSTTARVPGKSLVQLREELFDSHGAPPFGTAERMANQIRQIRDIHSFPPFLKAMGIKSMPSKQEFTSFLRRTVEDSVKVGYSKMPLTQSQAYQLRLLKEPKAYKNGLIRTEVPTVPTWPFTFFPEGRGWSGRQGRGRGRRGG